MADWSVTDYLLAAAVDQLAIANWMFTCVNSDDPPEPPEPVARPGGRGDEGGADAALRPPADATANTTGVVPPSPTELARFFS
nr:hypothetical protein [Streptomyces tsukubensis NRRL18488]